MLRLTAPLLAAATALSDETSLMQGLKLQHVAAKDDHDEKSKAISNLLQSATSMLKNGATPDVVDFAQATLNEITSTVLPAIENAHDADQQLIDTTFAMFEAALIELENANNRVKTAHDEERSHSSAHKTCRAQEGLACQGKIICDYELWAIWRRFVDEESTMREHSAEIRSHFCVEGANGTLWLFRDQAVVLFPPFIEQKPIVEHWELEYDLKRPTCETLFVALDDKTEECDAHQLHLERAACTHYNLVIEVRNVFATSWYYALQTYQRIMDEVHCLEIDRWKEWRTLITVECLLNRTTERNGRPCDETTDEVVTEVAQCERTQVDESINHLRIIYYVIPPMPPACPTPPWDDLVIPAVHPWPGRCVPEPPQKPCDNGFFDQEYASLSTPPLNAVVPLAWMPPQPEFHSPAEPASMEVMVETGNSHCNQRPECGECTEDVVLPICFSIYSQHTSSASSWLVYPTTEHECSQHTLDQLQEGVFDLHGNGHYTQYETVGTAQLD